MKQASPILVIFATVALGVASTLLVLWTALHQPWIGLTLTDAAGTGLHVAAVDPDGPATRILRPGDRLLEMRPADAPEAWGLQLVPQDKIEEPDSLPGRQMFESFLDRQGRIAAMLAQGPVVVRVAPSEGGVAMAAAHPLTPAPARPFETLPAVFWVQVGVGLVGVLLAGWVMALRRQDRAVQYFLLAGAGLMLSAHAAAIYSTRELALPREMFTQISRVNFGGTLLFGIGMINLFLVYPTRLVGLWGQIVVVAVFGASIMAICLDWPEALQNRQMPVAVAMLVLLVAILVQVFVNRRNPTARAMLGWFGLAVLIGAGGFGLTVTLPILLGHAPRLSQGYAFLFFLVIFAGLAMGIARYRLFDLSEWSFRILFYIGGVVLLLGLDAALIYMVALDRVPALGLSLALVGLLYLPLRDGLGRWLRRGRDPGREELFALVTEVTLANAAKDRGAALNTLLQRLFDPLRIEDVPPATGPARLLEAGEALDIPMPQGLPGRRLYWAGRGRRLFSRQDEHLATLVIRMLDRTIARQRERDQAVEMERSRINRDMHDNIGVQLLGALHSPDRDRKDSLIRQTLADLRQIISRPATEGAVLSGLLADLRGELGEHLEAAGIALSWEDHGLTDAAAPDIALEPPVAQTLRALLRESVSNILRHSGAGQARIVIAASVVGPEGDSRPLSLAIEIADDGRSPPETWRSSGNGLANLRHRIEVCGGTMKLLREVQRTSVQVALPVQCERAPVSLSGRAAG